MMKLLSLLSALSLAFSPLLAHPLSDGPSLEQRQSGNVVTSGANDNTVRPRLEIRQLKDNFPDQYALLVLAMEQWKINGEGSTNWTSYWGVASIHGVPRRNWDGVQSCSSCSGANGYCTHNSVLFPAWHRAYMALYEQEFLQVVKTIANQYPAGDVRTRMVNAANVMRWPYWDWAAHAPAGRQQYPRIISDYTVTVEAPSGTRTITPNPLFRYDFGSSSDLVFSPFTTWQRTYRYPTSNDVSATSNTQAAINAFANMRQSLQDQVYALFTNCHDYLYFSNTDASSSSSACSNSLEGIHNTVHMLTGGGGSQGVSGGHMYYLPLASYDPIFWLHHANVDRIFAMWQTLNPNSYGASQVAPSNTWTIAQGSTQDANSPLEPFFQSAQGNFWTTNGVKDWTVYKYTYPEFIDSDGSAASITNYVNNLYGPNANAVAGSSKRAAPDLVSGLANALPGNPLAALNGSYFEYVANIHAPRYALNGSYTVYVFHGTPASESPASWPEASNLIGTMGVLSEGGMSANKVVAAGSVPLTRTLQSLVGSGLLSCLTEAVVVPFLSQNLHWRISGPLGESVDPGSIPGFAVSVVTSTAQQPASNKALPQFSPFTILPNVTSGRSGGLNHSLTANTA